MDPQSAAAGDFFCHSERRKLLVMPADVFPHLVMPVWPIVSAFRAPVVQVMSDAAVSEDFRHPVGRSAVLPRTRAGHQPDVATSVLMQIPVVILVGHIVHWIIEVEVIVVHSVHRVAHVVNAGESVTTFHVIGMFKKSVGSVIGAERCAERGDSDARRLALGINERENFVRYVCVVLRLHPAPMERMRSLVCERIALHAVDAEDPDAALIDVRCEGAYHTLALLLPFVAHAGREGEDGRAIITIYGDAHLAIETVEPTLMVTVHVVRGYRVDDSAQAWFL